MQMQDIFKKVDSHLAVAVLVSCMIWYLSVDSILGKAAMVSVIVASTLYHRIAGILAVMLIIAVLRAAVVEGFAATPAAPIQFASSSEFREKYCMKGIGSSGSSSTMDYQYMLSPALVDDINGKPQLKPEVMKQIDIASLNACKTDSNATPTMCDPKCNWTIASGASGSGVEAAAAAAAAASAASAAAAAEATEPKKEGFAPMIKISPVQNAKNYVKDKLKESFSRFVS
jgi:ribosomal protein S11